MRQQHRAIILGAVLLGAGFFLYSKINKPEESAEASSFQPGKPEKTNINLTAPSTAARSTENLPVASIKLRSDNTAVFRGPVNIMSVAKAQTELLRLDGKLPKGEPIYLILDTPGGDIVAGNQFIDTAKSLKRPVHTITVFAASMGFNMAQRLNTRYILPSGTLMAHRAYVSGVEGQIPGEFLTAAATLYNLVSKMEKQNASRLGISFEEYTTLVKDEYWVDGEDSVRQGAADSLALITCDKSLEGTYVEQVNSFFGTVDVMWAKCPAVTVPLGYSFSGAEEHREKIREMFMNRRLLRKLSSQEIL